MAGTVLAAEAIQSPCLQRPLHSNGERQLNINIYQIYQMVMSAIEKTSAELG